MVRPFVARPVPRAPVTWLQSRPPARGAQIELENLLARADHLLDVTAEEIEPIERRYDLDLSLVLPGHLEALFIRYLRYCLQDERMADDEVTELVHLKRLLRITDRRARELHDAIAGVIYQTALVDRLSKWGLRPDHETFLSELREAMLLSDEHVDRLHRAAARTVVAQAEAEALSDVRLSPDEEAELTALADGFGVRWPTAVSDRSRLERLREYWRLDNDDLPVVDTPIALMEGERVHYRLPDVTWTAGRRGFEPFVDAAAKVKSMLAALVPRRWRDARPMRSARQHEAWAFDTGDLYLSSHFLHFEGKRRRRSIPLLRIIRVRPGNRRLFIERVARGPTVVLELPGETDRTFAVLTRLIREARWRRVYRPLLGRGPDAPLWEALAEHEGDVRER